MKPIFLIGYMGCGKSTLGRAVAAISRYQFIDLDTYIENRYHKSVKDIFRDSGEDRFREIERRMLEEVSDFEDVIVACGGGTPCYFDNMRIMNEKGVTVYLTVTAERLFARLSLPNLKAKRPTIAGKTDEELRRFIEENLEKRNPYYSRAALIFDSSAIETADETKVTAAELLEIIGNPK